MNIELPEGVTILMFVAYLLTTAVFLVVVGFLFAEGVKLILRQFFMKVDVGTVVFLEHWLDPLICKKLGSGLHAGWWFPYRVYRFEEAYNFYIYCGGKSKGRRDVEVRVSLIMLAGNPRSNPFDNTDEFRSWREQIEKAVRAHVKAAVLEISLDDPNSMLSTQDLFEAIQKLVAEKGLTISSKSEVKPVTIYLAE